MNGVLVVDKPRGPTSHDVVARARRALGTRSIGHAGTLDPMATGVLVLAVGEGTKLVAHLTAEDKEYEATITLGTETDSLDADGEPTATAALPASLDRARARDAAARFVGTYRQEAPAVSAIKVAGRPLHARVRKGEEVKPPAREVTVNHIEILEASPSEVTLRVSCGKGFYVRALGRDLARALGTVGHLSELRRTRSGSFALDRAVRYELLDRAARGDDSARGELIGSMATLREAWAPGPTVELTGEGARDAAHGRPVSLDRTRGLPPRVGPDDTIALLYEGHIVALARWQGSQLKVTRGIRSFDTPPVRG